MRRWLLVVALVLSTVAPFLPAGRVEAFAGRPEYTGFLTGVYDPGGRGGCRGGVTGGDVLCDGLYPGGAAPAEDFLNQLWADLTYAGGWGQHNQVGVQFIVSTMMGFPPGDPRTDAAYIAANVFWGPFATAVRSYETQTRIDWNATWSGFTENTFWQGDPGPADVAWYYSTVVAVPAIIFMNPNGTQYVIKKECGNPLGTLNALASPPVDYDVSLNAQGLNQLSGSGTVGDPYKVLANQTYSLKAQLYNNGPAASEAGTLQIMRPTAGVCAPGPGCPASQAFLPAAYASASGYRAASGPAPFPPGGNWYWNVISLQPNEAPYGVLDFTPVGAPTTIFAMQVYYYKGSLAGALKNATVYYQIVSQRTPGISGANGDIHAGGGTCGAPPGPGGSVTTSPSGSSVGQYVVSASGSINSIFSNNATTTANDRLRVGGSGGYSQICRADLLAAVNAQYPLGAPDGTIIPGGPGSTATLVLNGAQQGVYYFNGAKLILSGTVGSATTTKPLTIVARNGAVEIDDDITLTNVMRFPHEAPSLGIIASGDIAINPGATQVDAYLFSSNGTIITCNAVPTSCANVLRVNGFLMARDILFGRTGPLNTNGTPVAEQVVLTPQIYLNPPRYFDAGVDDILLEGQGERAPLF